MQLLAPAYRRIDPPAAALAANQPRRPILHTLIHAGAPSVDCYFDVSLAATNIDVEIPKRHIRDFAWPVRVIQRENELHQLLRVERNPPLKAALRGGASSGWLQASVQATVFAPVLETVPWQELK